MSTQQPGHLPEERVQALLRCTLELYQRNFTRVPTARIWLASRGVSDLTLADRHRLGWSDGDLASILPNDDDLRGALIALGLLSPAGRERLAHRIIVPVFFADGQIASLVGLKFNGTAKTLSGRPLPPWNLTVAKSSPTLWLVPSILDGLALACAGTPM